MTNGGGLATNQGAYFVDFPVDIPTWVSPDSMMNVMSLAILAQYFCITFDSAVENAFHIHSSNGILKFHKDDNNMYSLIPPSLQNVPVTSLV